MPGPVGKDGGPPPVQPQPTSDSSQSAAPTPQKDTGYPSADKFESGKPKIDLFPKDVLQRAAEMKPADAVNAHLNTLKSASTSSERAAALRDLRGYLNTLPLGEQAKVLTDSKVEKTIKEIVKDPKSPAASMLKDLMKGTIGDVVKGLQAVSPDVSVDAKKMQLEKAGVKVDVPKLLNLIKKDYGDIL
jgi:hypothetical protein